MRPSKKPKIQVEHKKTADKAEEEGIQIIEQDISKCPICQEKPVNPFAARCGHIW